MSSSAASPFGWDLLYRAMEANIHSRGDSLICYVHWALLSNGFRCIGVGEDKTLTGSENSTELLPDGWNSCPTYSLRYTFNGRLVLLKASLLDQETKLLLNLLCVSTGTSSASKVPLANIKLRGSLATLIPEHDHILRMLRDQLLGPIMKDEAIKNAQTQTQTQGQGQSQSHSQSYHGQQSQYQQPGRFGGRFFPPPVNPPLLGETRSVGRADLDPFGRGGGMLFDPLSPRMDPLAGFPGVPRGSVPPGARFDPIRPPFNPDIIDPVPRFPRNPDNDEPPPPGFDDMFS